MPDKQIHAFTARLDKDLAAELEAIARVNGSNVSEQLRLAVRQYVDAQRNNAAFVERLRDRHVSERALYERLAN